MAFITDIDRKKLLAIGDGQVSGVNNQNQQSNNGNQYNNRGNKKSVE